MSYSDGQMKAFKRIAEGNTGSGYDLRDAIREAREGERGDLAHKVKVGRLSQE